MKLQIQKMTLISDSDEDILNKYRISNEDWVAFERLLAKQLENEVNWKHEQTLVQQDLDAYFTIRS